MSRHPSSMIARVRLRWLGEILQMSAIGTPQTSRSEQRTSDVWPSPDALKMRAEPTRSTLRLWQPSEGGSGARRCTISGHYIQSLREGGVIKLLPRNSSAIRRPSFKIGYSRVEAVRLEKQND